MAEADAIVEKAKELDKTAEKYELKESLLKSVVYRILTVILGFTTALIITGDIAAAISVAGLTELVQFGFYFLFEVIWTNIRTKKRIEEEIKRRMVDLKINLDSILEIAYEMSLINTYVKEVYESAFNFFMSALDNPKLEDVHDEISKHFERFKETHKGREFTTYETV